MVNTSGTDVRVHVLPKSGGWRNYTCNAGHIKESGSHKIANADPRPGKVNERKGVITDKDTGKELWKGEYKYWCPFFNAESRAGVLISDEPTSGGLIIEIIPIAEIVDFLLKYFGIGKIEIEQEQEEENERETERAFSIEESEDAEIIDS